jgi:hypothetical protein
MLQPSPLKRNLVPRFAKDVAQEMMKDALIVENEDIGTIERRKLLGFSCNFSFRA